MRDVCDNLVIDRIGNVLLVDFRGRPQPPAPHFPGASGLRGLGDRLGSTVHDCLGSGRMRQSA